MKEILKVNNLSSGYGGNVVIKEISMAAARGEFIGIIGPNGAGKSTLLKACSRVLLPFNGTVSYDGADLYAMPLNKIARSIAVVPQETLIVFEFLVWDVVMLGRIPYLNRFKGTSRHDLDVVQRCMEETDTAYLSGRLVNELSAGERQRVIIAKALAQEPGIIMLDEPTSHLDISHQIAIFDLLQRLSREKGLTVIAVLHDLNLASEYCDKLILMDKGSIVSQGAPQEVLNYKTIEEAYKTVVVVRQNPISGRPYVFLVPNTKKEGGVKNNAG